MLRDVGVRTKLLAVLAIPTVLLVVVTALLVGGQVSAARRAGQVNALTDVAIQVNRVVHSLQEERSATLGYLQDAGRRRQGRGWSASASSPTSSCASCARWSPTRPSSRCPTRSGRPSPARPPPTPSCRGPQVRRRRPVLRHRGRRLLHQGHPHRPRPARRRSPPPAPPSWRSACRPTRHCPAPSSTPPTSATWSRSALLRGTLTEADFALSAALVAQQRQAPAGLPAGRARPRPSPDWTTRSPSRRSSRSTRYAGQLPDLLKGQDPDVGGSVAWVAAANSRIAPMTNAESALVADIATVAAATQNSQERRALVLVVGAAARPRPGADAGRRRWPAGSPGRCAA